MRSKARLAVSPALLAVGACYHVTIDTGRAPNGTTIEKPWAASFIYGLVPPPVVETAGKCPNGVAKVETQQSFLNGLVAGLTFGIFTPWDIKISCASTRAASTEHTIPVAAEGSAMKAIERASDEAVQTGEPVYVQF